MNQFGDEWESMRAQQQRLARVRKRWRLGIKVLRITLVLYLIYILCLAAQKLLV